MGQHGNSGASGRGPDNVNPQSVTTVPTGTTAGCDVRA